VKYWLTPPVCGIGGCVEDHNPARCGPVIRSSATQLGEPRTRETIMNSSQQKRRGWSWWYLLFVVQFVAVLWPPFFNRIEPTWIGIPYFYWYQMLWVLISAVFTAVVYFATRD
jgi:hypothetical protein